MSPRDEQSLNWFPNDVLVLRRGESSIGSWYDEHKLPAAQPEELGQRPGLPWSTPIEPRTGYRPARDTDLW